MAHARDIRVLTTGGNSNQYSVFKHQMLNGDIWVRCSRCSRTWAPPVEKNFYFRDGIVVARQDGVFDATKFEEAKVGVSPRGELRNKQFYVRLRTVSALKV